MKTETYYILQVDSNHNFQFTSLPRVGFSPEHHFRHVKQLGRPPNASSTNKRHLSRIIGDDQQFALLNQDYSNVTLTVYVPKVLGL